MRADPIQHVAQVGERVDPQVLARHAQADQDRGGLTARVTAGK